MKKLLFIIIALLIAVSSVALGKVLTKGHQHEMTKVDEVAATCTAQGTEAHYFCSGCGKYFEDLLGETEIKAPEVIEALGHDYTPWTAVEGTDNHQKTCSSCGDEQTKAHAWIEMDRVNPTHNVGDKITYVCSACSLTKEETIDIDSVEHKYVWVHTMITAPTYTAKGLIESAKTCTVCHSVNTTRRVNVPAVNKDTEGYELLVSGVASRWQYTYDGTEFIIDLMESGVTTETYSFGPEAWYVDTNDNGAPTGLEGFKHTNANWWNTGFFAGDDKTYTTTIVVDKPTAVTLLITAARNEALPFYSTTDAEHVLDWVKLNGSSDGVIYDMNSQLGTSGEAYWKTTAVATLFLEKGTNVISFNTSATTNFKGIGFMSTEEIKLAEDSLTLDLMSFNVRLDADSGVKSWAERKDALIASVIARNPSVVCFQEVKPGQYSDLAAGLTGYTVVWYSRQGTNNEGLAIAYKTSEWNEIYKQRFWLSETPDVESKGWDESHYRICVNVLLQHKTTGQYLNVFTVHLGLTETSQVNGMQVILNEAQKYNYPTFIAGDFNCKNTSDTYANTANLYIDAQKYASITEYGDTFNSWGRKEYDGLDYSIDFCFVSREHFAALEFDICQDKWGANNENYLSDHYAIMTKVALLTSDTDNEEPIAPKVTYTFAVKDNDPFAAENGGSAIDTAPDDGKDLNKAETCYENTFGSTFTFTVFVSEATTVEFYMTLNNKNGETKANTAITNLTLNGKDITVLGTEIPKTTDWSEGTSQSIHVATLNLQKGANEITFVRDTDMSQNNNLNIRGIKLVSSIPVSLAKV